MSEQKTATSSQAQNDQRFKETRVFLKLVVTNPLSMMGLAIIVVFLLLAIIGPYVAPYPLQAEGTPDLVHQLLPPSLQFPFGTDEFGRDIFSRVIFGARISLLSSAAIVGSALIIGIPLGAVAGYYGEKIGSIIMRITDMFLAFPPLLLALAVAATLGGSMINAVLALIVTWWPWYTRLAYSQALATRNLPYVDAARAIGVGDPVIVVRHIMPATLAPIVVQATLDLGSAILSIAGLSFLGLGAQPPTPDWGLMVNTGRTYFLHYWWYATFPGLAIMVLVLGFNFFGDAIREAIDPKLSRRRLI
jgi:peptide/nickel transport system permease protein